MALSTKLVLTLAATLTDALDLSTVSDPLTYTKRVTLTSGTGDDQADMLWHDTRTLSASASENIDLAGVLTNAFGDVQTFVEVKALLVAAAAANTNDVDVTSDGTNGVPGLFVALGDGVSVRPDGLFLWVAPNTGATVTASTGDLLVVTNSAGGTSVTYDIIVIGASA